MFILKFFLLLNLNSLSTLEYYNNTPYNPSPVPVFIHKKNHIQKKILLTENTFLKDVMKKFTSSITVSVLTSLIVSYKFSDLLNVPKKELGKSLLLPLIGGLLIYICCQAMFTIASSCESLIFTSIFFYLKGIVLGGILSILYRIYPKENITLSFLTTLLVFGVSFFVGYVINKDLTNITIAMLVAGTVISLLLLFGLGVNFLTNDTNNIRNYFNKMSIGLSFISIITSIMLTTYIINHLKLTYKNILIDLERDYNYYQCHQYIYSDQLVGNFVNIFLEILNLSEKK